MPWAAAQACSQVDQKVHRKATGQAGDEATQTDKELPRRQHNLAQEKAAKKGVDQLHHAAGEGCEAHQETDVGV